MAKTPRTIKTELNLTRPSDISKIIRGFFKQTLENKVTHYDSMWSVEYVDKNGVSIFIWQQESSHEDEVWVTVTTPPAEGLAATYSWTGRQLNFRLANMEQLEKAINVAFNHLQELPIRYKEIQFRSQKNDDVLILGWIPETQRYHRFELKK